MNSLRHNKLLSLVLLYLVVVLVAIPLTLVTIRKPQNTRTQADTAASLYFAPNNIQANTGETFTVDVMVNPGTHAVSFITLDVAYDPTRVIADPGNSSTFQVNAAAFGTVLEGPVYDPGRIRAQLSIGNDPIKAITTETKVATLTLKAVGPTNGEEAVIHFGEASYLLSVSATDNATNNVLVTVQPVLATLTGSPTADIGDPITPIPTFAPTITPPTEPTVEPSAQPTITSIQPTCAPLPDECIQDDTLPICSQIPAGGYCNGVTPPPATPTGQATPAPIVCQKFEPADIILVLDASGSMHGNKFGKAIESAKNFIRMLKEDATNKFGVVTFSKDAELISGLTRDKQDVFDAMDNIKLGGGTCIKCGIETADQELKDNGRADAKKIIILLTDGKANKGGTGNGDDSAEQAAIDAVTNAKSQGLTAYTIGIGNDVNPDFLQQMADMSGGQYYFANDAISLSDQFKAVYKTIADAICKPVGGGQDAPTSSVAPSSQGQGQIDPVTIIMILLLFLPLFLLIGHLLV